jgi:hypothetical protein
LEKREKGFFNHEAQNETWRDDNFENNFGVFIDWQPGKQLL